MNFLDAFNPQTVGQRKRRSTFPPGMTWCVMAFGDDTIYEIDGGLAVPACVRLDELYATDWEDAPLRLDEGKE